MDIVSLYEPLRLRLLLLLALLLVDGCLCFCDDDDDDCGCGGCCCWRRQLRSDVATSLTASTYSATALPFALVAARAQKCRMQQTLCSSFARALCKSKTVKKMSKKKTESFFSSVWVQHKESEELSEARKWQRGSGNNNNDDNGTRISTRTPTRTRLWMQMWMARVNANANVNVNEDSRREGKPNTLGQFSFVFTVYDAANSSETLANTLSTRVSVCCACTCVCVVERVCGVRREGSSWLRLRLRCDTSTYSTPTDATASAVVGSVSSAAALASLASL